MTGDIKKPNNIWSSKWEFLLSCIGLSVGLGNVWRFPYVVYKNGGGAFLIPYFIMLTLAGRPLYFMELAIGQFSSCTPIKVWSCVPIAKGVGVTMVMICVLFLIMFVIIMAYILHFLSNVFQHELPWARCDPTWANGTNCFVRTALMNEKTLLNSTEDAKVMTSTQVYWLRKVLNFGTFEEMGGIKFDLAICLLVCWVIIVLCLLKGIKTSGKVVYFAATFPYISMIALLIVGLFQPGAIDGIIYFLKPDFSKLLELSVWQDAAIQMFYSLNLSVGAILIYSSYNKFNHNVYHDAMVVTVVDTVSSLLSGMVTFSVLGAMAYDLKKNIKEVADEGPGLIFVAYPESLKRLPWSNFWSFVFFFMLFLLALDSAFATMENVVGSIVGNIEALQNYKFSATVAVASFCFLCGLPFLTRPGLYIIMFIDQYGIQLPMLCCGILECFVISWIYGVDTFISDIKFMLKISLSKYWKYTWKYTSLIVLFFIFISKIINVKRLNDGAYIFPLWTEIFGWCLTAFVLLQIPFFAILVIMKQKNESFFEKFKMSLKANEKWGPKDENDKKLWLENTDGVKNIYFVNI